MWLADASAARRVEESRASAFQAAELLRRIFDEIPLPVWRRDSALRIIDCNESYAAALDSTREAVLAESRELGLKLWSILTRIWSLLFCNTFVPI